MVCYFRSIKIVEVLFLCYFWETYFLALSLHDCFMKFFCHKRCLVCTGYIFFHRRMFIKNAECNLLEMFQVRCAKSGFFNAMAKILPSFLWSRYDIIWGFCFWKFIFNSVTVIRWKSETLVWKTSLCWK